MAETTSVTVPQSNVAKAGWICLVVGIVFQLIPFPFFWLYGPLFLASFVIGIVSMTRGQTGNGIILLISSVVLPIIGFVIGIGIMGETYQ